MKKNSLVEGTILASLSLIIIKVLGALYVIPFYDIVGELGGALYSYAYSVYALIVDICTAGIPLAISKIVSEYNTLEMYEAKERTLKIGNKFILILSVFLFFIMFIFAKEIAFIFIGDITGGNTIEDVELVIRSISFCMLIVPLLAVKKGYLQGQKFITATTNSQLIEQIVRIAFLLFGSYLVINVLHYKVSLGVAISVFSAFIAGLVAYIYLSIKISKNQKELNIPNKKTKDKVSNKIIFNKIIKYSIPLIIVAISADIYGMTDLALVIRGLSSIGYSGNEAETIASVISTWAAKICQIVNAIACGLSISLIPYMVSSLVKKDYKSINNQFIKSLGIILIVGLPMSLGISLLSNELYLVFYGQSEYGGLILRLLPFAIFFVNINYVITTVLQSLNKFKTVYTSTIIGLVTNAALDIPFIYLCHYIGIYPYYGAMMATICGGIVSLVIALKALKKDFDFKYKGILNILKKMILPLIIMGVVVFILEYYLKGIFTSRYSSIITCGICGVVGALIYAIITFKNNLLYDVMGKEYVDNILKKLRLKK